MILPGDLVQRLTELGQRLLDQKNAHIIVDALGESSGYWFGGGNVILDSSGNILISGRYRNEGDARTGTGAGARGLECAVFSSKSTHSKFEKILSFSKDDLSHREEVVSIEGVSLLKSPNQDNKFDFIISTEKKIAYPKALINFQKPGTGVWSIDMISSVNGLASFKLNEMQTIASSEKGSTLHVKDPVGFNDSRGNTHVLFCHHPFSWSSSNTGLISREAGKDSFELKSENILNRGNTWDVACSRITEKISIPKLGQFADIPDLSLYFYDGAECLRPLDQNPQAAKRPRGYSCEELGGLAWGWDDEFPILNKISINFPLFISPFGTGCSRYASAVRFDDDSIFATWQQSQSNYSQPLVGNHLSSAEVKRILVS